MYMFMHVQVGASGEANNRGCHNQAAYNVSPESKEKGEMVPGITPIRLILTEPPKPEVFLFFLNIFILFVPFSWNTPPVCLVYTRPGLGTASSVTSLSKLLPESYSPDLSSKTLLIMEPSTYIVNKRNIC